MGREIVIVLAIAGVLNGSATVADSKRDEPTHRAARAALGYFESVQDLDFESWLQQLRRPAPSPYEREMVIRTLPEEGELTPTAHEAAKLARIRPVLALHGRAHDMEARLITVGGSAVAGLHARTVLLISREALELLDTDELLTVMAHELGHDYVWDEYEEARQRRDMRRLQELELWCDAIAIIAMDRLGIETERLVSAATKLVRYNERIMGPSDDARYVPLEQRVRFIRAVARLTTHVPSDRGASGALQPAPLRKRHGKVGGAGEDDAEDPATAPLHDQRGRERPLDAEYAERGTLSRHGGAEERGMILRQVVDLTAVRGPLRRDARSMQSRRSASWRSLGIVWTTSDHLELHPL